VSNFQGDFLSSTTFYSHIFAIINFHSTGHDEIWANMFTVQN
jgi:hypothetical protein